MTAGLDAGLADAYWRRYFTSDEVAEIEQAVRVTGVIYGDVPVHVRVYHRADDAPTITAPHGLIVYGFLCARLHLAFWRAGYNVVSWDLPGFGQSGGPRNGPTIGGMIDVWHQMIDWAAEQYGGDPVYVVGLAEDGVTGYYAAANNPNVRAHLVPPPARVRRHRERRLGQPGLAPAPPGRRDRRAREDRPLGLASTPRSRCRGRRSSAPRRTRPRTRSTGRTRCGSSATTSTSRAISSASARPPVSFEDCRTPTQLITSKENGIWPPSINDRTFARLGCEKELVRLEGWDQWAVSREFNDLYAGHVMNWFARHGARAAGAAWRRSA